MNESTKVGMAEWLNENAYRAFPFEEDSDRRCTDGTIVPDWLVLDAKAMLFSRKRSYPVDGDRVGLKWFSVTKAGRSDAASIDVGIVARIGGGEMEVRHSFPSVPGAVSHVDLKPNVIPTAMYFRISMFMGAPATFEGADPSLFGRHELPSPLWICRSRCIVWPGGFGMDSVWTDRGASGLDGATGMVHLRNGNNTSLRIAGGAVELSISEDAGYGYECPDEKCDAIYFINGQRADTDGNFSIVGGDGVEVSAGSYDGIPAVIVRTNSVVDSYAKPK